MMMMTMMMKQIINNSKKKESHNSSSTTIIQPTITTSAAINIQQQQQQWQQTTTMKIKKTNIVLAQVFYVLFGLMPRKTYSRHGIPAIAFKNCFHAHTLPGNFFHPCLWTFIFPSCWKYAYIQFVPKKLSIRSQYSPCKGGSTGDLLHFLTNLKRIETFR